MDTLLEPAKTSAVETPPYRVYWIPGCTSCLKLKEFMGKYKIPFISINALEHKTAQAELEEMGCKGFPVLARGKEFAICQTLEPAVAFVKRDDIVFKKLSAAELMDRAFYFFDIGAALTTQIPLEHRGHCPMAGRDRTLFYLAFHSFQCLYAFTETVEVGNTDLMKIFTTPPPDDMTTVGQVVDYAQENKQRLQKWWAKQDHQNPIGIVETFYGDQTIPQFLERSVWHSAQHMRQLEAGLDQLKLDLPCRIDPAKYEGLPIPEQLWV